MQAAAGAAAVGAPDPPLLHFAPHALPTPDHLQALLAALPPSITALDLRAIHKPFNIHLTPAHIATIQAQLPSLQHLLLPTLPPTAPPQDPALDNSLNPFEPTLDLALTNALPNIPELHTLYCPSLRPSLLLHLSGTFLLHPAHATRLRSLTLPGHALPTLATLAAATTTTLPHLAHASFHSPPPLTTDHLSLLATTAPSLRSLELLECSPITIPHPPPPPSLTTLTALTLTGRPTEFPTPSARILHHVGTHTALRSLTLNLLHHGWTPAEAGWLAPLTNLTKLDVLFKLWDTHNTNPHASQAPMVTQVARAARHPHLVNFSFGCLTMDQYQVLPAWMGYSTPHSLFHHLAAATQLRRLCLNHLPLPAAKDRHLPLLQPLTALTCLELHDPVLAYQYFSPDVDFQWVTALQSLRKLHCSFSDEIPATLWPPLGALPRLRSLALSHMPAGQPLAGVLQGLRHSLRHLDLSKCELVDTEAVVQLIDMRWLEVLKLGKWTTDLLSAMQLPFSLHSCYLGQPRLPPFATPEGVSHVILEALETLWFRYPLIEFHVE